MGGITIFNGLDVYGSDLEGRCTGYGGFVKIPH